MITETEAKTKWCPMSRPVFPAESDCGFQPGNRDISWDAGKGETVNIRTANACIGSACMAWRSAYQRYETHEPPLREGEVPKGEGWVKTGHVRCCGGEYGRGEDRVNWQRKLPAEGYCGAFGKPSN